MKGTQIHPSLSQAQMCRIDKAVAFGNGTNRTDFVKLAIQEKLDKLNIRCSEEELAEWKKAQKEKKSKKR